MTLGAPPGSLPVYAVCGNGMVFYIGQEPATGTAWVDALDAATGEVVWRADTGTSGTIYPAAVLTRGSRLWVTNYQDRLCLDAANGAILWRDFVMSVNFSKEMGVDEDSLYLWASNQFVRLSR